MTTNLQATIQWYDNHAQEYAAKIQSKAQLTELKQFATYLSPHDLVLDAGCAAGRDSKFLQDLGFQVIGVDLSNNLLKLAKKNCPDIKFIQADLVKLPFKNEFFNGIWASACLVHLEKQLILKALLEFKRVLKPNGVTCLSVQNRKGKTSGWAKDAHSQEGRFFQFLNMTEIKSLVTRSGLKIIKSFSKKSSRPGINWSIVYAKRI